MQHLRRIILLVGLAILAVTVAIILNQTLSNKRPAETTFISQPGFRLTSPAFEADGQIPETYTCKYKNTNPPLRISSTLEGIKSYALIMHDPDAKSGDAVHWVAWNIPGSTKDIPEAVQLPGMQLGTNSFGNVAYAPPCPPPGSGTHHYVFELYGLSETLDIPAGSNRDALMLAINGKVIQQAELVGTHESP